MASIVEAVAFDKIHTAREDGGGDGARGREGPPNTVDEGGNKDTEDYRTANKGRGGGRQKRKRERMRCAIAPVQ